MFLTKNEDYYKEIPSTAKDIRVGIVPDQEAQVAMVMALDSDIAKVSLNDLSNFMKLNLILLNMKDEIMRI